LGVGGDGEEGGEECGVRAQSLSGCHGGVGRCTRFIEAVYIGAGKSS
jgi:hypothetical protein